MKGIESEIKGSVEMSAGVGRVHNSLYSFLGHLRVFLSYRDEDMIVYDSTIALVITYHI